MALNDLDARFIITKLIINGLTKKYFSSRKDTTKYLIIKQPILNPAITHLFSRIVGHFNFSWLNLFHDYTSCYTSTQFSFIK